MKNEVLNVEITSVEPHPQIMEAYVNKNLQCLELALRLFNQLEPIKVIQREDKYLIFDGISRYRAALSLGWDRITVQVYEIPDEDITNQSTIRKIQPKRSIRELTNYAELFLGILGKSQGKKRESLGDLAAPDEDFGLEGKDRFQIACEIAGIPFSSVTLRKLLAVKDFNDTGDDEVKELKIWDKLESGDLKINTAHSLMKIYKEKKSEEGRNELTETLKTIKERNYTLYNSTCEDLSELEDESIDCCVGSPPYFSQRLYPIKSDDPNQVQLGMEKSVDDYISNLIKIYQQVFRLTKNTGSLFIVISDTYDKKVNCLVIEKLCIEMEKSGWKPLQTWIWAKQNPKPQSNMNRLLPSYEKILHFVKDPEKYYWREFVNWKEGNYKISKGSKDVGMGKKRDTTTWTLSKPLERFHTFLEEQHVEDVIKANGFNWAELKEVDPEFRHMAPYPSYIPLLPILMTTKIGYTVLDVFNGTGSTTSVARQLGRTAIGYDIDPESHKFAVKRMDLVEQSLPTIEEVSDFESKFFDPAA